MLNRRNRGGLPVRRCLSPLSLSTPCTGSAHNPAWPSCPGSVPPTESGLPGPAKAPRRPPPLPCSQMFRSHFLLSCSYLGILATALEAALRSPKFKSMTVLSLCPPMEPWVWPGSLFPRTPWSLQPEGLRKCLLGKCRGNTFLQLSPCNMFFCCCLLFLSSLPP